VSCARWWLLSLNGWITAALGLVVIGHALPASASEEGIFTLSWQAPTTDCPTPDDVRAEVVRLLGGEGRLPAGRDFRASALVAHSQTWSVSIQTELAGRSGRRSIEAASCQDLADATAMILALAIDPNIAAALPPRAKPSLLPPPPPVPAIYQPAPQKRSPPVDFLFGLQSTGSQGTLPSVDVGVGGSVGLVARRYRVELRAAYGLRRDQIAKAATPADAYGRFNFLAGTLVGCFNLGQEALAFGPCADVEVGVVSAQGFGVSESYLAHRAWLAVGAGGYSVISLARHWSVPLHLDVLAPIQRPEFVFNNVPNRVFQAPAVGIRASVGIEMRF
jgi:hypothetical protein